MAKLKMFIKLYNFMKTVSADARSPHYNFACGTVNGGYRWRMFVDQEVCWVGINDRTSEGSKWPAFYDISDIKHWIKNN